LPEKQVHYIKSKTDWQLEKENGSGQTHVKSLSDKITESVKF